VIVDRCTQRFYRPKICSTRRGGNVVDVVAAAADDAAAFADCCLGSPETISEKKNSGSVRTATDRRLGPCFGLRRNVDLVRPRLLRRDVESRKSAGRPICEGRFQRTHFVGDRSRRHDVVVAAAVAVVVAGRVCRRRCCFGSFC